MTRRRLHLRSFLHRHRRLLAALCAALSVLCLGRALAPQPHQTVRVVVARSTLPPGTTLRASDLEVLAMPRHLVPDQAVGTPEQAIGRVTATGLTARTPLTAAVLVGAREGTTDGSVLVSLRIPDPELGALLRAGDRIDVLAPGERSARTVVSGARVVSLPSRASSGPLGATDSRGMVVILAVPAESAEALAQANTSGRFTIVVRGS